MKIEYNARTVLESLQVKGNYPKGSPENDFQREVMESLRLLGWFVYHIEDTSWQSRLLDIYAITLGSEELFLELKVIDKYTFNLSRFESDQIKFMMLREKHGLQTYVMIFSKKKNDFVVTTFRELIDKANERNGIKLFS